MPKQALTQADIELLNKTFATKDEVRDIVQQELRNQVGALPTREEFFDAMDQLMGEVKAMREEQALGKQRIDDAEETLDAHDGRLTTLESNILTV